MRKNYIVFEHYFTLVSMRTSRRCKRYDKKTSCSHTAHKAKRRRKFKANAIVMPNLIMRNESINDLENINEILRNHKSNLAHGKGCWKVMPKDSCEVYKNRRRRNKERRESNHTSDGQTEETDYTRKKRKSNGKTKRSAQTQRKCRHRSNESSFSGSLHTTTCSSTCTSFSEMEYD